MPPTAHRAPPTRRDDTGNQVGHNREIPMFGTNNADDSSTNTDQDTTTDKARRFLYSAFGIGENPESSHPDDAGEENTTEEDTEEVEPQGTIPSASLRGSQPYTVRQWTLGSHTVADDIDADDIKRTIAQIQGVDDDLADVLGEAAEMVQGRSIDGFECPVCGLNHKHSDRKHDLRRSPDYSGRHMPGFNITPAFADEMPYSPYCHCGVNWLAKMLHLLPYTEQQVFSDDETFAPFLTEADPDQFTVALETLQDAEADEEKNPEERVTIEDALLEAGLEDGEAMVRSLDQFYTRWSDIQSGAESAPIADETVTEMEAMVEDIEARIAEAQAEPEYELAEEGEVGHLTFLNQTGRYGFIATDEREEDVFFHADDTEFINTTFEDLVEGVEVLADVTLHHKGPYADRIEVTEAE